MAEALRISQDKKADQRAIAAADLTLKRYTPQEAWIVDYATNEGRHIRTFTKKKEADEFAASARVEVRHGIHTPSSKSIAVAEAGKLWLASAEKNKLERTTIDGYMQHLTLHIEPFLGKVKLSDLSTPMVREFEDKLSVDKDTPRSPALVKKVRGSLGAILADAQERGLVARNLVRELRSRRRRGKERRADRRQASSRSGSTSPPPRSRLSSGRPKAGGGRSS